jgi:hypothetical protein
VVDTHREAQDSEADTAQEVQDTNKLDLVDNLQKANTSTHNCFIKSRKFCCNKRTWEAVAVEDMVEDMEEVTQAVESHLNTAHPKSHLNMDHLDTAQHVLLESNLDMSNKVVKLLNT